MATTTAFDPKELESKVKAMYRSVARLRRRRDQQRGDQSGDGQVESVRGGRASAEERRPFHHRRHVTEVQLPDNIVCNSTLWAACIGGAAQRDDYRRLIEQAGLQVARVEDNPQYQFIPDNAIGASRKFGVKSISLLAVKQ